MKSNEEADGNVIVKPDQSWTEQVKNLKKFQKLK